MSKGIWKSRIGLELALTAFAASMAALLAYLFLSSTAYRMLDTYFSNEEVKRNYETACVGRLQRYVDGEQLKLADAEQLGVWLKEQKNLLLILYRKGEAVYTADSLMIYPDSWLDEAEETEYDGIFGDNVYEIQFRDGTAKAVFVCYMQDIYYSAVQVFSLAVAFLILLLSLLWFIRGKIRYIAKMEREIKILGGGDLTYPVTVRGRDELASLASEIDSMRRAILDRQEKEQQAENANRQLITAMSHDLRTPLTALIGYLEILSEHKYEGKEQLDRFLRAGRDKAYQIKNMSDQLFAYFTVYGKEEEKLDLRRVNGQEFAAQLVEESLFDMEARGFKIRRSTQELNCTLMVDVDLIRRVFDNLFSNLLKYADESAPVEVCYRLDGTELYLSFKNRLYPEQPVRESSNIGLKTCKRIIESHGGSFTSRKEGDTFLTVLILPTEKMES